MNFNLRGGLELVRRTLFGFISGRGFFWTLVFAWMAPLIVYLFVWSSAAGQDSWAGFQKDDFITYYLILMIVNQLTYPVSNWTVGNMIRTGAFNQWLLRPLPPIYEAIGGDIAMKIVSVPFALLLTGTLALILHPVSSFSWPFILTFIPLLVLAQCLRFLASYTLALLALWSNRADALLTLDLSLIFLLGGQVAPTVILPGPIQSLAAVLPYRYMLGFPIEALMGKLSWLEIFQGLGWQVFWVAFMVGACLLVWRYGLRRYSAVGG